MHRVTTPAGPARPVATVEEAVRAELSKALGGMRGIIEAAIPTLVFTITFLTARDLQLALICSVSVTAVLLVVRVVQRQTIQFVFNSLVGIGIGALFAWRSLRGGGSETDAALAYFLPGLLYNAAYAVGLTLSIVVRWPIVGFMVGSVTGDPTAWRSDPRVVQLCSRLTWLLVLPCVVRVVVQTPFYLAGRSGFADPDQMIALLGVSKIVMGWPLQVAALSAMVWLLARNATPLEEGESLAGLSPPDRD